MRAPAVLFLIAAIPAAAAQGEPFYMLHMQDNEYLPMTLEVPAKVTITIMNFGQDFHTVTHVDEPPLFDVREIPPPNPDGSPQSVPMDAPTEPGTYPFFCRYHGDRAGGGMAGTLVVTDARAAAATTDASPSPTSAPTPPADAETPVGAWLLIGAFGAGAALTRPR